MRVSLIVSYYKNERNLSLIFKGLSRQSESSFEVIIAEDDCSSSTASFLKKEQKKYSFPIVLISQKEDNGFRKNQMLNRAILISKSDKICLIDGDCVPHKHFIRVYDRKIRNGLICYGKRVNLGEKITEKIYLNRSLKLLNSIDILRSDSGKIKEGWYLPFPLMIKHTGLLGCNWGILKSHLLEVNGFDEDYISAGVGEDVDIEWRLKMLGLKMVSTKNRAIVYHLYHPKGYTDEAVNNNFEILKQKQLLGKVKCSNGIEKL